MLESANDAAVTLAEGVSGSRSAFVADDERRAPRSSASTDTSYANPIGLDDPGQLLDAPRDLAALARRLLRDQRFAPDRRHALGRAGVGRAPARRRTTATTWSARYPFVDGVKTGHTGDGGLRARRRGHGAARRAG